LHRFCGLLKQKKNIRKKGTFVNKGEQKKMGGRKTIKNVPLLKSFKVPWDNSVNFDKLMDSFAPEKRSLIILYYSIKASIIK
jgi:hypothetical protein